MVTLAPRREIHSFRAQLQRFCVSSIGAADQIRRRPKTEQLRDADVL